MSDQPTEIPTNPEIVEVEHPDPHIVGSDVEPAIADPTDTAEVPNVDEAANEDEDRQAGIGGRIAEKVEDAKAEDEPSA